MTSLAVSSTPYEITLLGNLINPTSVLTCSPSMWRPIINAPSDFGQRALIRILSVEARYSAIGSEGTAIATGDLFNNLRIITFTTPKPTGVAPTNPLSDIIDFPNMEDVGTVVHDQLIGLPSQAFNSTDYNVPMVKTGVWRRKLNILLDCRTSTAAGTSGWYTVANNIYVAVVSDSIISPNPHLSINFRFTARSETF